MSAVFYLLATVAILGAFDTLYYHEWRARLVTRPFVRRELLLHAARDFVYAILFGALPWVEFHGVFAYLLGVLLVVEIAITLADFIVEDDVRKPLGGVYPGERATHALIGIVYGAMLGYLVPILAEWSFLPSDLSLSHATSPHVRVFFVVMGVGVFLSGVRDLLAAWTHSRVTCRMTDTRSQFPRPVRAATPPVNSGSASASVRRRTQRQQPLPPSPLRRLLTRSPQTDTRAT